MWYLLIPYQNKLEFTDTEMYLKNTVIIRLTIPYLLIHRTVFTDRMNSSSSIHLLTWGATSIPEFNRKLQPTSPWAVACSLFSSFPSPQPLLDLFPASLPTERNHRGRASGDVAPAAGPPPPHLSGEDGGAVPGSVGVRLCAGGEEGKGGAFGFGFGLLLFLHRNKGLACNFICTSNLHSYHAKSSSQPAHVLPCLKKQRYCVCALHLHLCLLLVGAGAGAWWTGSVCVPRVVTGATAASASGAPGPTAEASLMVAMEEEVVIGK